MDWTVERRWLVLAVLGFALVYAVPMSTLSWLDWQPVAFAVYEGAALLQWYAREHVILCLLPAFLVAGGMAVFIPQSVVLRYLGPDANRAVAIGVASVSGTVLAVCSCTVLPLFGGLYKRGAGIGPAVAFLYTGPAINVIAIVMTTKVLGLELGIARAIGAVVFAVVIGLAMQLIFGSKEAGRGFAALPEADLRIGRVAGLFGAMLAVLVFANWASVSAADQPLWAAVAAMKWWLAAAGGVVIGLILVRGYGWRPLPLLLVAGATAVVALLFPGEPQFAFLVAMIGLVFAAMRGGDDARDWMAESWSFAKQIMPLLLIGVFVAGVLLGRPGEAGLIPGKWVAAAVGGESLGANLVASVVGSLMYFATLTEVPIVQSLQGAGMGNGPALALLLAGPALSLPNMLAIRSIMGTRRTAVYVALVVACATLSGFVYGTFISS
jgi:uncharacterized membrane protein YraQ (UPF0718 family)